MAASGSDKAGWTVLYAAVPTKLPPINASAEIKRRILGRLCVAIISGSTTRSMYAEVTVAVIISLIVHATAIRAPDVKARHARTVQRLGGWIFVTLCHLKTEAAKTNVFGEKSVVNSQRCRVQPKR